MPRFHEVVFQRDEFLLEQVVAHLESLISRENAVKLGIEHNFDRDNLVQTKEQRRDVEGDPTATRAIYSFTTREKSTTFLEFLDSSVNGLKLRGIVSGKGNKRISVEDLPILHQQLARDGQGWGEW